VKKLPLPHVQDIQRPQLVPVDNGLRRASYFPFFAIFFPQFSYVF
jgi:hypothetical protein